MIIFFGHNLYSLINALIQKEEILKYSNQSSFEHKYELLYILSFFITFIIPYQLSFQPKQKLLLTKPVYILLWGGFPFFSFFFSNIFTDILKLKAEINIVDFFFFF